MRRNPSEKQLIKLLLDAVRQKQYFVVFLVVAVVVAVLLLQRGCPATQTVPQKPGQGSPEWNEPEATTPEPTRGPGAYLFCFWNVENLFDDVDDGRKIRGDAQYDGWFANHHDALAKKLEHLCDVLLAMNDGRGPDILAVAEIESQRSVELLRISLNRRLTDPTLHYRHLAYEHSSGGRNIAPAVLSRLPLDAGRTRLVDSRMRIVETQVPVVGRPLVLIASHWTSRISDKDGSRRAVYADKLYGRYRQMVKANPKVDLLICGDFNDNPEEPSVTDHLRATGDRNAVSADAHPPTLFNLFAKPRRDGQASHYYGTKPFLFDQVVVSPGMLDGEGWSCDPASAQVIREMATWQGRPNRFGGENDKRPLEARGASDHFPVVVQLRVR